MKANKKYLTPARLDFFKSFLLEGKEVKIMSQSGFAVSVAMSMLRACHKAPLKDHTPIEERLIPYDTRQNLSGLVTCEWLSEKRPRGQKCLLVGGFLDDDACNRINTINAKSLAAGNGICIMVITNSFTACDHNGAPYDWAIADTGMAELATLMYVILQEFDSRLSKAERTPKLQHLSLASGENAAAEIFVKAVHSYSVGDALSAYGRLGVEIGDLVSKVGRSGDCRIIEWITSMLMTKTSPLVVSSKSDNITVVGLSPELERTLFMLRNSYISIIRQMDQCAYVVEHTSLTDDLDNPDLGKIAIIMGIARSSALAPAAKWLTEHPDVSVLVCLDSNYPNRLTIRTLRDDIDLSVIGSKYVNIPFSAGQLERSRRMIRLPFTPEQMVIAGTCLGKECGFGGAFGV